MPAKTDWSDGGGEANVTRPAPARNFPKVPLMTTRLFTAPTIDALPGRIFAGPVRRYDMQTRGKIPAQWDAYNQANLRAPSLARMAVIALPTFHRVNGRCNSVRRVPTRKARCLVCLRMANKPMVARRNQRLIPLHVLWILMSRLA